MDAVKRSDHDPREPARTLGDLLYADTSKSPVSEKYWVGLVHAIAAGDQLALRSLYEQTHRLVYTLMVRITGNQATADELTLDVFHDVWRRAVTYDPAGGSVAGWIMNQARSRAIDRLRFENRKKRVNTAAGTPLTEAAILDPLATLDASENGRRLREALKTLAPDERQAIEAAFFSELTYHEVAERLQQPLGTIKTRIRSGLAKLRSALGMSTDS